MAGSSRFIPITPAVLASDGEIELYLRTVVNADFGKAVGRYVSGYFSRLRDKANLLGDRVQLSRFSLHVASLARILTQIHLALTSGRSAEELQQHPLHFLFFEYGTHDSFLLSLSEPDFPWRRPLSSRIAGIVSSKLENYVRLRTHFWMREQRVTSGDLDLIPFSYSALHEYLIPTLESVCDLQDARNQLLVLGRG